MTPQPESWLARAKRLEPAKLVGYSKAVFSALSLLGYVGLNLAKINAVSDQFLIIAPPLLGVVVWPCLEWLSTRWLRSKVTPQARAEPIAVALETAERARATGQPYSIPLGARKAAARVLGKPEPKPRHPTRATDA